MGSSPSTSAKNPLSTDSSVCKREPMEVGVEIRKLERDELSRDGEIDRTERIDVLSDQRGTELVARTGGWDAPAWYARTERAHGCIAGSCS